MIDFDDQSTTAAADEVHAHATQGLFRGKPLPANEGLREPVLRHVGVMSPLAWRQRVRARREAADMRKLKAQ